MQGSQTFTGWVGLEKIKYGAFMMLNRLWMLNHRSAMMFNAGSRKRGGGQDDETGRGVEAQNRSDDVIKAAVIGYYYVMP